jgi:hypothetical protein
MEYSRAATGSGDTSAGESRSKAKSNSSAVRELGKLNAMRRSSSVGRRHDSFARGQHRRHAVAGHAQGPNEIESHCAFCGSRGMEEWMLTVEGEHK